MTLKDLPAAQRERIENKLREIMPLCKELTADEMAWVTAACLRYQVMKIPKFERPAQEPVK